jgi:hypothetical protein
VTQPNRPRAHGAALAIAFCLMFVSMVACGSGDPPAPTTTAPEGYTAFSDAKQGFALAVPSDWTRIPLSINPAVFDKDANALRLANKELASILNQARVLGQSGGIFMAVSKDGKESVNITADKPKEKTVQEVVAASVEGLTKFGATNIAQEAATVSGQPAIKVTFRLPVETDAGTVPTDEIQHYLLKDKKAYILTVAGAQPSVASAVAASLRIR